MDARQFIAEFGHIANAPGGVARLRQMIYQLAVTGSLTPRGTGADAGELLTEIEQTRQALIRAKNYKRMLEIESEAIRLPPGIALPPEWRWSRLLNVGEINPRNDAPDDQLVAFVPMSGVPQLHKAPIVAETRRWEEIKKGYTHFANGDVVLAKITPCFENGKAAVVANLPGDAGIGAGTTELLVFRPIHSGLLPGYVYLYLRSPLFTVEGEKNMTGTAGQKRVPTDYFATRAFPLPPTEEQSRIVAKVDELMTLSDKLEAQQQARCHLQTALRRATLQALASTESPRDLQTAWSRVADNFGQLFSAPEDVMELRAAVLDLAISGVLTEQVTSDEPVGRFIDRCISAKTNRLASGEMKRKTASATDVFPLEMEVAESWKLLPLQDLFQFIDYRGQTPKKTESGVVLVTAKNVRPGRLCREPIEYISEKSYTDWMTRGFPKIGDILFTTEAPLGNVALIEASPVFALAQRIIDLQPFANLNTKCAMYFMMSPTFQALLERNSTGMTAKGIKAAKLKQLELPTPPIEEQARIVERIELFLRLCDEIEKQLRDANKLVERLAAASVAALTGIAIEQEEASVKAPKTELLALLHLGGKTPSSKDNAPLASILARRQDGLNAKDLWQRWGMDKGIDAFYAQLKLEVANGWIREPELALMNEIHENDALSA